MAGRRPRAAGSCLRGAAASLRESHVCSARAGREAALVREWLQMLPQKARKRLKKKKKKCPAAAVLFARAGGAWCTRARPASPARACPLRTPPRARPAPPRPAGPLPHGAGAGHSAPAPGRPRPRTGPRRFEENRGWSLSVCACGVAALRRAQVSGAGPGRLPAAGGPRCGAAGDGALGRGEPQGAASAGTDVPRARCGNGGTWRPARLASAAPGDRSSGGRGESSVPAAVALVLLTLPNVAGAYGERKPISAIRSVCYPKCSPCRTVSVCCWVRAGSLKQPLAGTGEGQDSIWWLSANSGTVSYPSLVTF